MVVQGDTTTAAMAGIAAFNMQIPVAHVEAGLRTHSLVSLYPEELNRKLLSCLSRFNFAPTERAANNLFHEGISPEFVFITGNTIVDSLNYIQAQKKLELPTALRNRVKKPFVLITAHRRENFGDGFVNICKAFEHISRSNPLFDFVFPVHFNPNVREPVNKHLRNIPNMILIDPVNYIEMLSLLKNCEFCMTDSGGIQEEAPSFQKYTIVLREVTERMESVELGLSELVGAQPDRIIHAFEKRKHNSTYDFSFRNNPFGDGRASERIVTILSQNL